MQTPEDATKEVDALKDGQHCYINMFQDGGASIYRCNGMLLIFEIPLYGGKEQYMETAHHTESKRLVDMAFSWT